MPEGTVLGKDDGTLEGLLLLLGAPVVGGSLGTLVGMPKGTVLGEGDETLEGLLLGAPVAGASLGTARGDGVGTLEGLFLLLLGFLVGGALGTAEGADDGDPVAAIRVLFDLPWRRLIVALGGWTISPWRCNRRCQVSASGASSSWSLSRAWALLRDFDRRIDCCNLSSWQPTTRQAVKNKNVLDSMTLLIVSFTIFTFVDSRVKRCGEGERMKRQVSSRWQLAIRPKNSS
jgi:hypothetical protein